MNKDDILKVAQKEKRGTEYEHKAVLKSDLLSALMALIVGAFLFFFEYIRKGTFNWGIATIVLTACATQALYEGIKLRKTLWIIVGVIQTILALIAFAVAIVGLVGNV